MCHTTSKFSFFCTGTICVLCNLGLELPRLFCLDVNHVIKAFRVDFGGTIFAVPQDEETIQLSRSSISVIIVMVKLRCIRFHLPSKLTLDIPCRMYMVLFIGRILYVDIR